jgi:uncharacterized protein YbaR (Trm112 family)
MQCPHCHTTGLVIRQEIHPRKRRRSRYATHFCCPRCRQKFWTHQDEHVSFWEIVKNWEQLSQKKETAPCLCH